MKFNGKQRGVVAAPESFLTVGEEIRQNVWRLNVVKWYAKQTTLTLA